MRNRSSWGETIALILRDCEPEARLEFMRALGQWKRMSVSTIKRNSEAEGKTFEGDRLAAEERLVKLAALEEHLQREMESDRTWREMFHRLSRQWF